MKNRVITISREFGSGGRTIGKMVAQELGIPCYDAEIIQAIAQESGFSEGYIREAGEYTPGGVFANVFSNRVYGPTNEDYLWTIQYQIITELARKGSCVIVGRCADYILRDTADCLKVFVHADLNFRAKRIVEVYGERDASPEQRLKDKDKRRAAYLAFIRTKSGDNPRTTMLRLTAVCLGWSGVLRLSVPFTESSIILIFNLKFSI